MELRSLRRASLPLAVLLGLGGFAPPAADATRPPRPIEVTVERPWSARIDIGEPGEGLLDLMPSARATDWRQAGREATVLEVSVDGRPVTDLVVTGSPDQPQRVHLGHLAAGRHRVAVGVAADRSPVAGPVVLDGAPGVTTVADSRTDLAAAAERYSPLVFGRALAEMGGPFQNATTDAPLLAYHELLPGTAPGRTRIQYTYVWSNEDGGTNTPQLMARWGRATDIEWVYAVEVDDATGRAIAGTGTYQGAAHVTAAYPGDVATHPLLQTCTSNNNLCAVAAEPPRAAAMRFALGTTEVLPAGAARESMMDAHPWTYQVMSDELAREGKVEPDDAANPSTDAVSDPAHYLYVQIDHDTAPADAAAAVGLTAEVVLHDGRRFTSTHGHGDWSHTRDTPAATTVELPPGTTATDVAQLVAVRSPAYAADPGASLDVTSIAKAFFLGADHRPRPSFGSYEGHTQLTPLNPTAVLWPTSQPVVVAHRGASAYRPEHTFAAYDLALGMGADYIEQDMHLTADGVLVDIHDDTLDRTARGPAENCTGPVMTKTLAQLRTCDFGSWFGDGRFAGEAIPTLEELFQRYGRSVRYYIETKSPEAQPGMEQALLALLDRYALTADAKAERRVLIQSFSPQSLIEIHQLDPALPLVQLGYGGGAAVDTAQLDVIRTYAIGFGPTSGDVTPELVAAAHARCLDVHPYTVNTTAAMTAMLDAGVDGMFTNNPDVLRAILDRRPPAPTHCH